MVHVYFREQTLVLYKRDILFTTFSFLGKETNYIFLPVSSHSKLAIHFIQEHLKFNNAIVWLLHIKWYKYLKYGMLKLY